MLCVLHTFQPNGNKAALVGPTDTRVPAMIRPSSKCYTFTPAALGGQYAVTSVPSRLYYTYWSAQTLRL
jgi:hypothetical protein